MPLGWSRTKTREGVTLEPENPEERTAFKLNALATLYREADARNWCSDFDRVLDTAGLPVRPRLRPEFPQRSAEGEKTAEEFDRWRTKAVRVLNFAGKRRNIPGYAEVLRDIGLGGEVVTVQAKIEVTATVEMDVQVLKGASPEEGVDRYALRDKLYRAIVDDQSPSSQVALRVVLPE